MYIYIYDSKVLSDDNLCLQSCRFLQNNPSSARHAHLVSVYFVLYYLNKLNDSQTDIEGSGLSLSC